MPADPLLVTFVSPLTGSSDFGPSTGRRRSSACIGLKTQGFLVEDPAASDRRLVNLAWSRLTVAGPIVTSLEASSDTSFRSIQAVLTFMPSVTESKEVANELVRNDVFGDVGLNEETEVEVATDVMLSNEPFD